MDIYEEGLLIPMIEYEVYNIITKEILDLNICKDLQVDISIPVNINEKILFKYNTSDDYYNDICNRYSTENNTDIILKDRRNEFNENNMSLCENNCNYKGYNNETKKVLCKCNIKVKFPLLSEIEINKDQLLNNFTDLQNTINLNIMKCYYILFNRIGLIKNIASYIMIIIIFIIIFLTILFRAKGYYILKSQINKILNQKTNKKEKQIKFKNNPPKNKKKQVNILKTSNEIEKNLNSKNELNNPANIIKDINKSILNFDKVNIKEIIINYNDYELNNLPYKEAKKLDKRTYFQYYFSLLKMKHLIVFTFVTKNDYNSKIIKIILFLFFFSLHYTINALFFNEAKMHKIYVDQGRFNIIYQIPHILYSTIITSVIDTIIKYLSLSEKDVIKAKRETEDIDKKTSNLLHLLLIKFITFFIFLYIFLIFFWYYLSCFCAIYQNTQLYLLKDTLITFGLSLIYPFISYGLSGIFRIFSLRSEKEFIYKFSNLIII